MEIVFSTGSYDSPSFKVLYAVLHSSPWGISRLRSFNTSTEFTYRVNGNDTFNTADKFENWLAEHLPMIEADARAKLGAAASTFSAYEAFADQLPHLFGAWRTQRPAALNDFASYIRTLPENRSLPPTELFLHTTFPQPERALRDARYLNFKKFIESAGHRSTCEEADRFVHAFWHSKQTDEPWRQPVKRCTTCGKKERGAKKMEQSASFGGYLDYVCATCMPNDGL